MYYKNREDYKDIGWPQLAPCCLGVAGDGALDLLPEGVVARGGKVGVHGDVGGQTIGGAGLGPPVRGRGGSVEIHNQLVSSYQGKTQHSKSTRSWRRWVRNIVKRARARHLTQAPHGCSRCPLGMAQDWHWRQGPRKQEGRRDRRAWGSLVDGVVAAGEGLEVADVLEHFWRAGKARSEQTTWQHAVAPSCAAQNVQAGSRAATAPPFVRSNALFTWLCGNRKNLEI